MAKTANTSDLENAIEQRGTKQAAAPNLREVAFKELNRLFERSAGELKKVLPEHITPARIARVTLTACRKNPALLDCDKNSLIGAVFQAAQIGLEPDLLGSCYLVPFKQQVQLIIGYKGYIDLIYRSPRVITIQAIEVYKGDYFKAKNGSNAYLDHYTTDESTDEVIGYYAIAQLQNGGFIWRYMTKDQIEAHRDQHSSDYKYKKSKGQENNTVWAKNFDAMAKKTCLHQLITWLPMEIQQKEFMAIDNTITKDIESDPEFIDMEKVTIEEGK
jgi:recombination protein RecT